MFEAIHHVSLNVHDATEVAAFYRDVLSFEELERPDFGVPGAWLGLSGGQEIHLLEVGNSHVAPAGQHFALRVSDISAAIDRVRSKGIEVSDPMDIPGGGRQSFLKDPAGNEIEINQPL